MRRAHKTLNIKYGATFAEVKQAYKKQAMEWHPDRFPADDENLQKQATQNFHKITEAFKRLEIWHTNKEQGKYDPNQPDYSSPEGDRAASEEADTRWLDVASRAGRARDGLVQRLLETLAGLGRARVASVAAPTRLGELARQLETDAGLRREAGQEVEAALA